MFALFTLAMFMIKQDGMPIATDEIFGPVQSIMKYK